MEQKTFVLTDIEGDYAYLTDEKSKEKLFIALSLLPIGSDIGTRLEYENFTFTAIN